MPARFLRESRYSGKFCDNGKEGSVRETQEGCPSPLKSIDFGTLKKFQNRKRRGKGILPRRCVRETQEGRPSPLKSIVFETLKKFQKLRQRGEKAFSPRCPGRHRGACPVSVFCFTDSPAKNPPARSLPAPGCRFSPAALPPPHSRPPRFL